MEENEKNEMSSSDDFFGMLIFVYEAFRNIKQEELDKNEKEVYSNGV